MLEPLDTAGRHGAVVSGQAVVMLMQQQRDQVKQMPLQWGKQRLSTGQTHSIEALGVFGVLSLTLDHPNFTIPEPVR